MFKLTEEGIELTELAPGIELERDILAHMDFTPIINEVTEMDPRIFVDEPMDLRKELLHLDLPERIALELGKDRLFINFEKMRVRSHDEVVQIREQVEKTLIQLGRRVDVVVNYDGFQLDDDIEQDYAEMVRELEKRFYKTVTRYSGSAFQRLKLGETFKGESLHVFESRGAAQAFLDKQK